MTAAHPRDTLGRRLGSLRVSVTDRCNLRCHYCMPEEDYVWLPRSSILTFEEIARLVGVFAGLGAEKVRITGGEPLLRHDLPNLIELLSRNPALKDLALTTNAVLLSRQAADLRKAGLGRITVSLDTLREERFREFARSSKLSEVFGGLRAARAAGFTDLKINSVIVRGFNDDEVVDLFEFACSQDAELRYIEYMDVGGATEWSMDQVVSREEILGMLGSRYGAIEEVEAGSPAAPARRFRLPNGRVFGIVASTTAPFCRTCDRGRITADGMFYLCLYADRGIDLRELVRGGDSDAAIAAAIADAWQKRTDRGAEERLAVPSRSTLYRIEGLRADPHREMHTRGG